MAGGGLSDILDSHGSTYGKIGQVKNRNQKVVKAKKNLENKESLKIIDQKIEVLNEGSKPLSRGAAEKEELLALELEKEAILYMEHEKARPEIRMIWLEAGDSNTKFFHQFTNHR